MFVVWSAIENGLFKAGAFQLLVRKGGGVSGRKSVIQGGVLFDVFDSFCPKKQKNHTGSPYRSVTKRKAIWVLCTVGVYEWSNY